VERGWIEELITPAEEVYPVTDLMAARHLGVAPLEATPKRNLA
jgi:hypothetical protein